MPPHDRPTLTEMPPVNDTTPPPAAEPPQPEFGEPEFFGTLPEPYAPTLAIPKGEAQMAFAAALDDVLRALEFLQATGFALARQLDLEAT